MDPTPAATGPDPRDDSFVAPALPALFNLGVLSLDGTGRNQRSSERLFNALLANVTDRLLIVAVDGTVSWLSPLTRDHGIAQVGDEFVQRSHPDDRPIVNRLLEGAAPLEPITIRVWSSRDRDWCWFDVSSNDLRRDPVVSGTVVSLHDVTPRVRHEEALRDLALHDGLTGLPNRSLLIDRLEAASARARRHATNFAVLFFDLDHFKDINDSLGHVAGDELLVQVAQRVASRLRTSDTFGRLGGDEFVIVIERLDPRTALGIVTRVCDDLIEMLAEPFVVDGHVVGISSSVGIELSDGTDPAEEVLRAADVAMYRAKSQGRARWVQHTPEMSAVLRTDFAVREKVAAALGRGEIQVHFQPIVALDTGAVVGVEGLARLPSADGTWIPPDLFVPVAESHGMIHALGATVLEQALRACAPQRMPLSVNVSSLEVRHPDFSLRVMEMVARCGYDPALLSLELTESSALDPDHHVVVRNLRELRARSIGLVIDDFGKGFSALERLRNFPATGVKIDRSFVSGLATIGSGDLAIVRAVVAIAESLGLGVVAEGVEDRLQADILQAVGVRYAQGYRFGRPGPGLPGPVADLVDTTH